MYVSHPVTTPFRLGVPTLPMIHQTTLNPGVWAEKTRPTATNIPENVRLAVEQLEPHDLPLKSRCTGIRKNGTEDWNPSYRPSKSGRSLAYLPNGRRFWDRMHKVRFSVIQLYAAEKGIISRPWDSLDRDLVVAIEAARADGAPIPEVQRGASDGG